MPGIGPITSATFTCEIIDIERFSSAAKLAAYAGLAPRIRQSGSSINSVGKAMGGNKRLKRVLIPSATNSILQCNESRIYYEQKRAEGRGHTSALVCLVKKRLEAMYSMLRGKKVLRKKRRLNRFHPDQAELTVLF